MEQSHYEALLVTLTNQKNSFTFMEWQVYYFSQGTITCLMSIFCCLCCKESIKV